VLSNLKLTAWMSTAFHTLKISLSPKHCTAGADKFGSISGRTEYTFDSCSWC